MKEIESEGFNKERDSVENLEMIFAPVIWRYPDGNQYLVQDEDFQEVLFKMIKLSEVSRVWVEVDKNDKCVWEEYPDFRKHRTFYRLQMYSPPDGNRFNSSYTELSNGYPSG
ncbi:hypothetical protein SDC9_21806 [bioreactor metagenome]|uniref:Uncharacterized protein n=1 Tax=bioreactor metagenome TaxID=1076179 RepID=A0A644UAF8_9ZZZZ|nr:hypothetical protein [Lentimicrobium sp.]MEA5111551.1 hypothetical protein [Lentimicrobium sp.]